jgi:NADPH:quinone reductase-like Zn-dependent oxidoreductase
MKAIVYRKYGMPDEVLHLENIDKPVPAENEVLVRVVAASVNAADWRLITANPFLVRFFNGLFNPGFKIPGADLAGIVESVGLKVTSFKPGDEVFGDNSIEGFGSFAEYVCVNEENLTPKPANLSFEEAASLPLAAITALQGVRDSGKILAGQEVLVHGSGGGVGTFSIQFAKYYGAIVTAVCSAKNMETAKSLGAQHVIDYTKEDFLDSNRKYDVILGVNGYRKLTAYKKALKPDGKYIMMGGYNSQLFDALIQGPFRNLFDSRKIMTLSAKVKQSDLDFVRELSEEGKIKPVIDRVFDFDQTAEAVSYVMKGHAKGKVLLRIGNV